MPYKCVIPPDQAGYNVKDGKEVERVKLDGGKGRYRRDILNSTRAATVQWTVGREEYEYLKAFYKVAVVQASTAFKIDMILDKATLTEHDAYFIPETWELRAQRGHSYTVAAQLEVVPLPQDFTQDSYLIALWEEFGSDWPYWTDQIDTLTNVDIPGAL